MTDLNKCPKCGGPADNGHDRCVPPNPYECSCCKRDERLEELKQIRKDHICGSVYGYTGYDDEVFQMAKEANTLRREKYKLEAVIEKMWQAIFHCKKCPPNKTFDPPDCTPEGWCRKCWSHYLEHEL